MKKIYLILLIIIFGLSFWLYKELTFENEKSAENLYNSENQIKNDKIVDALKTPKIIETATKVPIIMYHYVRDVAKNADPLGWNLSINPSDFEKQLQYLKNNGYKTIHLSDLIDGKVGEKNIVLSFDDGLTDFYTTALPLLKKYEFTASNGIITGMIGTHEHMTLSQIKECVEYGIEITSHTIDHPDLSKSNENEIKRQVTESRDFLVKNFSVDVNGFVYPSGKYNENVIRILKEEGYVVAVTTEYVEADLAALKPDNLLILPRIRIDNRDGFNGFVYKLENL